MDLRVIAHYIDSQYNHQTVLLALTLTNGSYTGESLSDRLLYVIIDYRLAKSISYLIADGAPNNHRAIDLLARPLPINPSRQRLRRAAHIINLVCTAILFGVDIDYIEDACSDKSNGFDERDGAIDRSGHLVDGEHSLKAWRKKGPLGKLHNLMIHIKGSSARRYLFESKKERWIQSCESIRSSSMVAYAGIVHMI